MPQRNKAVAISESQNTEAVGRTTKAEPSHSDGPLVMAFLELWKQSDWLTRVEEDHAKYVPMGYVPLDNRVAQRTRVEEQRIKLFDEWDAQAPAFRSVLSLPEMTDLDLRTQSFANASLDSERMSSQSFQAWYRLLTELRELEARAVQPSDASDAQDIIERLERLRKSGEKYTSQGDFATRFKCSRATISKAIGKSDTLTKWMSDARPKPVPRATSLNEVVADNAKQAKEPDPSELPPDDEVDAVMARLIDDAGPERRAELNAMNAEGRQKLAAIYIENGYENEPSSLDRNPHTKVKHHKHL